MKIVKIRRWARSYLPHVRAQKDGEESNSHNTQCDMHNRRSARTLFSFHLRAQPDKSDKHIWPCMRSRRHTHFIKKSAHMCGCLSRRAHKEKGKRLFLCARWRLHMKPRGQMHPLTYCTREVKRSLLASPKQAHILQAQQKTHGPRTTTCCGPELIMRVSLSLSWCFMFLFC
jgi:hypothetical protein